MNRKMRTVKWGLSFATMVMPVATWVAVFAGTGEMEAQETSVQADGQAPSLQDGFVNPPASARPRVWWHWMNGNISEEGIKLDLEWMHRVGIAGFQNFDAALSTPQVVKERQAYMTPEWKESFRYATKLADQLGMEEAIAGSPGWSESGGPWVTPADGMKKYVWSETVVEGGKPFAGKLAAPPSSLTGPFQSIASSEEQTSAFCFMPMRLWWHGARLAIYQPLEFLQCEDERQRWQC